MDAPKGRYRVEEKDGRLVVIDTQTGAPISSPGIAPPGAAPRPLGPVAPRGPALVDLIARPLLRLVVNHWEEGGRAVVAWEWEENGRRKSWHAALDPARQKRLGRSLLAFTAFPLTVVLSIAAGFEAVWLFPLTLPATIWGVLGIRGLQRETDSSGG